MSFIGTTRKTNSPKTVSSGGDGTGPSQLANPMLTVQITFLTAYYILLESGLAQAETLTNLLFESDYSNLKATHVFHAFEDDPRLKMVDENELFSTPVIKLAAKHELVSSICEHYASIQ
jgi:hypothetical protein